MSILILVFFFPIFIFFLVSLCDVKSFLCHFKQLSQTHNTSAPRTHTEDQLASIIQVVDIILRVRTDVDRHPIDNLTLPLIHTIRHKDLHHHNPIITTRHRLSHSTRHPEFHQNSTRESPHRHSRHSCKSKQCRRAR